MPGSEIPDLQGVFRFVSRLHTMSKRGMRGALADCPRCHFGMLENLHILIEQRGVEGAIYVSEVARAMRQPMPAVSRMAASCGKLIPTTGAKLSCASPRRASRRACKARRH